jgi:hypothetical protein
LDHERAEISTPVEMTKAPDFKNGVTESTKETKKTSRASDVPLVAPAYGRLEDENECSKQASGLTATRLLVSRIHSHPRARDARAHQRRLFR